MPSAIVTGATGILGREIVFALGKDPQHWSTVYALSRSQKEEYPANVKHAHIDLTSSPQELAKQLDGVEAEYLFFAAYLQKDTDQENWEANGDMLKNFLEALKITGAEKKLKRVLLTTGAKQYGVHLGPVKVPMEETDPWLDGPDRPPNFYYRQQNILKEAADGKPWDWVVTYPNDVIGVAKGNFMNLTTSLALYAAVTKELGQPLQFPGSETFYTRFDCFTYSRLHAQFQLWAASKAQAGNQAFNVVNGDTESWQNLWPKLADRFGCHIAEAQFSGPTSDASTMKLADRPPVAELASRMGLTDRVHQGAVEQRIDLVRWSQKDEVKQAWTRLADRDGLEKDSFEKATWSFLGFVLGRNYDLTISMSKARRLGFTGYVDTWDAFCETFDDLENLKIIPPTK